MYIVEDKKSILLKLHEPEKVLNVIPTASSICSLTDGTTLVKVPHHLEETKVLNNLNIAVPSPIVHYYKWPSSKKPYAHQKSTSAFLTLNPRGVVLNDIGTGKTLSSLWALDYLMSIGVIRNALVISPLSTLERVWGDAMFTGFSHLIYSVLSGTSLTRKRQLHILTDRVKVVNFDGFVSLYNDIISLSKVYAIDCLIVDEAAFLRNPSTKRFKLIYNFVKRVNPPYIWLLTGTPTPNEPTDAWSLVKMIRGGGFTTTYSAFREQVMMKVSMFRWIPRKDAATTVKTLLTPSIRYTRDECLDLPETVVQTRQADLTPVQSAAYKLMLKHFVAEVSNNTITAVNEAVKMQKLVQIVCGVIYNSDGESVEIDCGPRIKLVEEIIEESGEKVIIFVPLTGVLKMLEEKISKRWTIACVWGATTPTKRNQIFKDFQTQPNPHVLIAHPGTMSHGLTLTEASTIIWYGPVTSNDQYTQACGRIERIGKKSVSNVIHIESSPIERAMYERLQSKQTLQGLLLNLIANRKDEYVV